MKGLGASKLLMSERTEFPAVLVHQVGYKLPTALICCLGLHDSGASQVGGRLVLGEAQAEELLVVELKGA